MRRVSGERTSSECPEIRPLCHSTQMDCGWNTRARITGATGYNAYSRCPKAWETALGERWTPSSRRIERTTPGELSANRSNARAVAWISDHHRRVVRAREGDAITRRLCLAAGLANVERAMSSERGVFVACNTWSRAVASWRADNGFFRTSLAPASRARSVT